MFLRNLMAGWLGRGERNIRSSTDEGKQRPNRNIPLGTPRNVPGIMRRFSWPPSMLKVENKSIQVDKGAY